MKQVKPVFIISLPRSGSTLLQRVLMSHPLISSIAEPHFLLPLVHSRKREGTITSYSHLASYQGITDMIKILPNKKKDYDKCINEFATHIYSSLSDSKSIYFLDKTPRYFWILPELSTIFPEAKFIFLFRNPIQIYASVLSTFSDSRFNRLYEFDKTLTTGFELLSKGYDMLKDRSISVQYEKFIEKPDEYLKSIYSYLELVNDDSGLTTFSSQKLKGGSKDPNGINLYNTISDSPIYKWKCVFNTRFRKNVLLKYVNSLSDHSLIVQGFDKKELITSINNLDNKGKHKTLIDIIDLGKISLIERFRLNLFFARNMDWIDQHYLC